MRQAITIEKLYLDFDGFFASVMQQAMPELRGRPVGVIPFETSAANSTVVIACSKEAKAAGCNNVMPVPEARKACPDIVLVTQRPDLFRRAHNALLNEISCEIPIETVKSIDELACKLDKAAIADPAALAKRIKDPYPQKYRRADHLLDRLCREPAPGEDRLQDRQAQWRDHLAPCDHARAAVRA